MEVTIKLYNKHLWKIPTFVVGSLLILIRLIAFLFVCTIIYPLSFVAGENRDVKRWIKTKYQLAKLVVNNE